MELINLAPPFIRMPFPFALLPLLKKNISEWAQQARQHIIDICVGNWQSFTGRETSLHLLNATWLQWWGTPFPQKQMAWVCSPATVKMDRDLNSLNWAIEGERFSFLQNRYLTHCIHCKDQNWNNLWGVWVPITKLSYIKNLFPFRV